LGDDKNRILMHFAEKPQIQPKWTYVVYDFGGRIVKVPVVAISAKH